MNDELQPTTPIEKAIEDAMQTPRSVAIDGVSTSNRSIDELITADKYLAEKRAMRERRSPLRFQRINHGGTV